MIFCIEFVEAGTTVVVFTDLFVVFEYFISEIFLSMVAFFGISVVLAGIFEWVFLIEMFKRGYSIGEVILYG